MEITQAYNMMLTILPYEERGLAKEIFSGSGWDATTGTAWYRAATLNLKSTLEAIDTHATETDTTVHEINLYCDSLTIDADTTIEQTYGDEELRVTVYARCIIAKSVPAMTVALNEKSAIVFYATEVPKGVGVDLELPTIEGKVRIQLCPGRKFGVLVGAGDVDVEAVHAANLVRRSRTGDALLASGRNDNDLLRLLQFQFLVASTQIKDNRSLTLRLLNYVCAASNTKSSRDLNFQATSLRCSILARQGTRAALVPSVNVLESKTILQARLISAANFERAFHDFLAQEKSSENLGVLASNALVANRNALTEYRFLEDRARQAYTNSVIALKDAQAKFNEKQVSLQEAAKEFQAGVNGIQSETGKEAAKDIVLKAVTFISAIVATVATAGIAAPVAGAAVLDAAGKIGEAADLFVKIRDVVVGIQELYEKFKPLLEKIKALVEAVQRMIDILENSESPSDQPKDLEVADVDTDTISGVTMWDAFTLDVRRMFEDMEGYDIQGKKKYQQALLHLPIVAKGVLTAQVASVTAGQALASVLIRQRLESGYQIHLTQGIDHIAQNGDILPDLKRIMFDQMLAIRNLVHLDFSRYKAAFQYYSLAEESDTSFHASMLQSIANYQSDAARMQAAISSFGASVRIQSKNFVVVMPLDNKHRLSLNKDNCLRYRPDVTLAEFQGYCRIRMYRVRAFLESDTETSSAGDHTPVKLQISTSGQFLDIGFPSRNEGRSSKLACVNGTGIKKTSDNMPLKVHPNKLHVVCPILPKAFVGEPRSVTFEYDPLNRHIVCDGYFGLQNDFTRQTPFQKYTLQTRTGSALVEWDSVTAVRWEFLCEICAI